MKGTAEGFSGINATYLENICGDDKEFIQQIIVAYKRLLNEFVDQSEAYLQQQRWEAIASLTHKIRSSSRFIGAQQLADEALALEELCKSESPQVGQVQVHLAHIRSLYVGLQPDLDLVLA
ncbi:Hpt domain-containing protein [Cytophagales bacterium LB-30]|uniref:Hpt domain-containing protein n=1 Tax=Shiella aurantiaca TaxID=3058365 RepID=A0ABT8F7G7_9BACT|nr:Hpt domain-containing protein [Shiella aurantiaca]MDN4166423.1 Hpt domain-containing protein [Shiella aurantiaca]